MTSVSNLAESAERLGFSVDSIVWARVSRARSRESTANLSSGALED